MGAAHSSTGDGHTSEESFLDFLSCDSQCCGKKLSHRLRHLAQSSTSTRQLFTMVKAGNPRGVEDLFRADPSMNIDVLDDDGDTALHVAAQRGHLTTIEVLVTHHASMLHNRAGRTPLDVAVHNEQMACADALHLATVNLAQTQNKKKKKKKKTKKNKNKNKTKRKKCPYLEGRTHTVGFEGFVDP
ncbi:hypothetical protein T484DRAFT_1846654 [Baffinella frigidus]|nr:hypothetical protein T484DRAFT_1846654 [Cryptophyta sp. CCMP2293]